MRGGRVGRGRGWEEVWGGEEGGEGEEGGMGGGRDREEGGANSHGHLNTLNSKVITRTFKYHTHQHTYAHLITDECRDTLMHT